MTADNPYFDPASEQDAATLPSLGGASDLYRSGRQPLDAIFDPRSVAVLGASERPEHPGRIALRNLIGTSFGGTVYPVTPHRKSVFGIRTYRRLRDVPEPVDLALIATPADSVPDAVAECALAGVRGAIVATSGLGANDPGGPDLARRTLEQARSGRVRLIGPHSLGVIRPGTGLNASVAGAMALPGHVGFLSQSGSLATAILDWSLRTHVGFSLFGSVGTMVDVGWGDLIDYLGDDPATRSIVIAMETVGDARHFLSAAREVALTKPIIVIKPGRTEPAARLVAVHTGHEAESDDVLEAAFRRGGVLRAHTIADVFYLADVLAKQPRPQGSRLAIVTNARGPGTLAVDALVGRGGSLAELTPSTVATLDTFLPASTARTNPVDVGGDAEPARFARAVEAVGADRGADGLLVILAPQAGTDPSKTAEALRPVLQRIRKPILASWMGGVEVGPGEAILSEAGVPTFPYPDTAARVFTAMARHGDNLRTMYETPTLPPGTDDDARKLDGDAIVNQARAEGRVALDEVESRALLTAHGLAMVETRVATNEDQAIEAAEAIGWPVAVRLHSRTIARKAEIGGVRLHLTNPRAVRDAFRGIEATVSQIERDGQMLGVTVQPMIRLEPIELVIGSWVDPRFGPVVVFGAGGTLGDVYQDRSPALPPLTSTLARRLMERTRIYQALSGGTKRPVVDLDALEQFIVRFSRAVVERPRIESVEIAPVFATTDGVVALDARVTLHPAATPDDQLPRPAIRPYPSQYASPWTARDGGPVVIRPIRAEDEPLLVKFHETLSERSVALRYFQAIKLSRRVAHDRLTRICFNDYDREIALVVDRKEPWTDHHEILGVGRLSKIPGTAEAEFALLINDSQQGRGFGTELLRRLLAIARVEKVQRVTAEIRADNHDMKRVCEKLGFQIDRDLNDPVLRASINLDLTSKPISTFDSSRPISPADTS